MASLKTETIGKLINRIPDSLLLISSLQGSALRTLVESLSKPRDVNKCSQSLLGKLDIKKHSPSILYILSLCALHLCVELMGQYCCNNGDCF